MALKNKEEHISKRSEIFKEFSLFLSKTIIDLYPGNDAIDNDEAFTHYYKYCYNKTCDEFSKQGLSFKDNEELSKYFYQYFYNELYSSGGNLDYKTPKKLWLNFFNYNIYTTRKDMVAFKCFANLYKIFEKSII